MMSADVKANVIQKELKDLVAVSYNFFEEVPSKLEMQFKKRVCFLFDFSWNSIHLDITC